MEIEHLLPEKTINDLKRIFEETENSEPNDSDATPKLQTKENK